MESITYWNDFEKSSLHNSKIPRLHNTVAPKISPRWYKLLPSAIFAQNGSVDQNKTLSNSHSLISFKTIRILSNFALTITN